VLKGIAVKVVGMATDPVAGLGIIEEHQPDLLILDTEFEDGRGREFIHRAHELRPRLRIVVLSDHEERGHIDAVLAAGADAYVTKTAYPEDLASAVRQVFRPSVYRSERLAASEAPPKPEEKNKPEQLTRRELEILEFVARGTPNAAIAQALWVTEQTVKFHLSNIYRKLHVSNRTEAARWAHMNSLAGDQRSTLKLV
jgi:DNA-binding NarL/FixJ family response regulator